MLTRPTGHRRFRWSVPVALLATLALALFAAACGGDDDDGDSKSTATSTSTAASADAFPITIEHKYGSTTIETEPKRVVAIGYQEHDFVYALGVKPVGVRYWYGDENNVIYPWAEEAAGGDTPVILNSEPIDIEAVAALDPDLILGTYSGITKEEYDRLSQIAPTVTQSGDYVDYGSPWQETAVTIGRALGREAEARAIVDSVEGQFKALADEHPEWKGLKVAVVSGGGDSLAFFASEDPRSRIFTSLGFEVPKELDDIAGGAFYGELSLEQAEMIDVDLIVWTQLEFLEGGQGTIESNPVLSQLDALKEGRVIFVDGVLDDAMAFNSLLSLPLVVEELRPMLEAAMDGDPATTPPASN